MGLQQLAEIRGMLAAAQATLAQAYTLTTQLAASDGDGDPGSGYAHYHAEAAEALATADEHLADVCVQREKTTVQPLLVIDCARPDWVYVCGQPVRMRPAESRLLIALARSARKVVRYADLYSAMWDADTMVEPRQMYAHACRLRRKLEPNWPPHFGALLSTVPRVGVVLNVAAHQLGLLELERKEAFDGESLEGDFEVAEAD